MKRISVVLFAFVGILLTNAIAQDNKNDVLVTIGNQNVTKAEFERIFRKNNDNGLAVNEQQVKDYLDLFIKFKLKVLEAQKLGFDTAKTFVKELAGYRKQLAKNYLTDNTVLDSLMRDGYSRMQKEVRASHILIKVDPAASPADTLKAWNKISLARKRILAGEDFEKVAKELSEDPSVKMNSGDLGFFTAFRMVPAFELKAFNSAKGEVSEPFRTDYGYHILKVTDVRPSRGEVKVAHILLLVPREAPADSIRVKGSLIKDIYNKLVKGEDFGQLALKYSNDRNSATKGGELPYFGTGKMIPQFEEIAFKLKKGEISLPFRTDYGWHIVKLIDKKSIGTFEENKAELQRQVAAFAPAIGKSKLVKSLKKSYKFQQISPVSAFYKIADTTLYKGAWDVNKAKKLKKALYSFADKKIMQEDFAKFLAQSKPYPEKLDLQKYIDNKYKDFVSQNILQYEEDNLEKKYEDFRNLIQEYHDGILLFDISDNKVWSMAVKDTAGLDAFYTKNKENYKWDERMQADVFTCSNKAIADQTRLLLKENKSSTKDILIRINKADSINDLKVESLKYSKGDNKAVDSVWKKNGISDDININNKIVIVRINSIIAPEIKAFNECKGLVTADYQNYLEEKWIKELKAKYPVVVNQEVLKSIK